MAAPLPVWFGLVLLLGATLVKALPDDREQPLYISSDTAVRDEKAGITVYQGDVDINQGSLNIRGDKVTVYFGAEGIKRILAVGGPASFKQKPSADADEVKATAMTIEYNPEQDIILLSEQAELEQNGDVIRSNKVRYDINSDIVEAGGGADNRVNIVIQPPAQPQPPSQPQ